MQMISSPQGITAVLIGLFSSIAIIFYGEQQVNSGGGWLGLNDNNTRLLLQDAGIGARHQNKSSLALVPSCPGLHRITSESSLKLVEHVLIDVGNGREVLMAQSEAIEKWRQTGDCKMGFIDFMKHPKIAARFPMKQMPAYFSSIEGEGKESPLVYVDCMLTYWILQISVHFFQIYFNIHEI